MSHLGSRNPYTESMNAKVSEKGQVTIPKKVRDRLGIRPGQVLDFAAEDGRLTAVKTNPESPVEAVYGILGRSVDTDALVSRLRGEPDAA